MKDLLRVRELTRTLRNLAASPKEQVRYLTELGTAPCVDELALEFDDALHLVDRDALRCKFPDAELSLSALNTELSALSGKAQTNLWTADALEQSNEWARVRGLARQVLIGLEAVENEDF